jgi:hypothetical protein
MLLALSCLIPFTFDDFLAHRFSPADYTIMTGGEMGFMPGGNIGSWLEGGNETILSGQISSVAPSNPIYPPHISTTASSLTNFEDKPFGDLMDDLVTGSSKNNNERSHPQTPTTATTSFGLGNDLDIAGLDNDYLDNNAFDFDDDMFGAEYISDMDISTFSDFIVLVP